MKRAQDLSKTFLRGAFILTFSAVIVKLLSAVYRVPYQNIVGDVGFYIYQQVYPIYSLALVLSTYGFPAIISKLLAESRPEQKGYSRGDIVLASWFTTAVISLALFLIFFFGSGPIAGLMNDPGLKPSIKLVSFLFLLIPFTSILKGLFQGRGEMVPTAVSQVAEQSVRVGLILVVAIVYYQYSLTLYEVAQGAYLGSLAGSVISCLVLAWYYAKKRSVEHTRIEMPSIQRAFPLMKTIMVQGLLFAVSSLILVFIQFLDALILYPELVSAGIEPAEAQKMKGIYDRGQPLLHLGTSAIIALSLTVIPLISKYLQQNRWKEVHYYTELTFRLSLMLGTAAAVGLFWIVKPVNIALFTDGNGSVELSVLVVSILFCSIVMTGMFVLQSLGKSFYSLGIIAAGLVFKGILMFLLIPSLGIMGAAISTTSSFVVMALALLLLLGHLYRRPLIVRRSLKVIALAVFLMSIVLVGEGILFHQIGQSIGDGRMWSFLQAIISVLTGAFVYITAILRGRLLSEAELALLPLGGKLARFLPKKK
ncbi:putative polysaccharide biosynthesis protein [Bacillus testis]|uniref:putative polysaccharide biosynthesis protein n=1 Tax=Bacillus testis TaxID=1622072 RepID=UPI00067F1123|nr:oligosaccharide flippase family protein [Bacillus testis]